MAVLSLNDRALRVVKQLADAADDLGAAVHRVGDARVIDAGVDALASIDAGLLLARICMADLGQAQLTPGQVDGVSLPAVSVNVRFAVAACMASQYAGWQITSGDYFAMGSGPMRAARGKEPLFDDIGFRESPARVVGVLEAGALPDEQVVARIAESCNVSPASVTLVVARTASFAGGVQVVARSVETAMHKLHELSFDLSRVTAGYGVAPLPPIAKNDMAAIGRTNDAVLYGAQCTLFVTGDDASLADIAPKLPSSGSKDYGQPFGELFKKYDYDFYKIDPMLFSPAMISLQNIETGHTHTAGQTNDELLARSFFARA